MQLVVKKLMMKVHAKQAPQKNGVVLMVMAPARDSVGIRIIPHSKTTPIDFARTGCISKRNLQMEKRLLWVAKPSKAPTNAPVNSVTDIIVLLRLVSSKPNTGPLDVNLTFMLPLCDCDFQY